MMNVDYLKFISYRYDLVLRYHFLEQTGFNIDLAATMLEQKKYTFVREIILRTGQNLSLFDDKQRWDFVLDNLFRDSEWTKKYPYIITSELVGVSVKRFLLSLYLKQPIYWTVSDKYYKPIIRKPIWERDVYMTLLTQRQSEVLMNTELKMLIHMDKLRFFRTETFVAESEAELI